MLQLLKNLTQTDEMGASYTPMICDDGRVGYFVQKPDHDPVFLYFNPSSDDDDADNPQHTVFVYMGEHNDPALDGTCMSYIAVDLPQSL